MRSTRDLTPIRSGWDVYDREGDHVGNVAEVGQNYVLVQKGLIFVNDIYVPVSAVDQVENEQIWLNVRKDDVDTLGWDEPPTQGSWSDWSGSPAATSKSAEYDATATEGERILVHEEELEARKTARQAGQVEVRKDVVEEQRSIDVPVTREEVRVRRTPVDREATADEAAFAEGGETIRVPVMEEDVEVTTRPRVKEEIEIEKIAKQDTERATGTVRKERVDVSGEGRTDADFDDTVDVDRR